MGPRPRWLSHSGESRSDRDDEESAVSERSQLEIPRGVYPVRNAEILRFAQDDKRRAQDDKIRNGMLLFRLRRMMNFSPVRRVSRNLPKLRGFCL